MQYFNNLDLFKPNNKKDQNDKFFMKLEFKIREYMAPKSYMFYSSIPSSISYINVCSFYILLSDRYISAFYLFIDFLCLIL